MATSVQLERIRYWQGQLLASDDLKAQMRVVEELRRQHNRNAHGAYGIAIGLAAGEIKDNTLPITCGLAYDCAGRELIIAVDTTVPLPSQAITIPQLLIIAYDPNSLAGLSWQPEGAPVSTVGVALARLVPGTPDPHLDDNFRPVIARPLARAKLATGETVAGDTAWESWDENGVSLGVQSTVDTGAAGFTVTPSYFAEAIANNPPSDFVPAWFASIADPTPTGFKLRLLMRRVTRETFDILSPRSKAASTPALGGTVSLTPDNKFGVLDLISRLLPTIAAGSVVTALNGNNATIDTSLSLTAAADVAFGNPPRVDTVSNPPVAATGSVVTVDTPDNFHEGDVVAKLGAGFSSARPTTVSTIDDQGELELASAITGLANGDQLGIAQTASLVTSASGTTVTVQTPVLFAQGDIVACVDPPVENFPPASITGIGGQSGEILTLSAAIPGINGLHLAPVQVGGTVQTVDSQYNEVKVKVGQPRLFRPGDMVAKILPGGVYTEPVRVQSVNSGTSALTLSKAIAGLADQDRIAAADFRIRSTVLNLSADGLTVTLANTSLYPTGSYIVRLNDSYVPTGSASVAGSSAGTLVLGTAIKNLKAGDVIALCSFPVTVTVQSIASDGSITVDAPGLIATGDVVGRVVPSGSNTSLPGMAIVASASGSSIRLATNIPSLGVGDTLSVVTVSGTINVTPTSDTKLKLEAGHRIRIGDFLANITGWREPEATRSVAFVIASTGVDLTLNNQLDGLMVKDNVGLATLAGGAGSWLWLRLSALPDVVPGDEALLVATDRLRGLKSMFAKVEFILPASKQVLLLVEGTPGPFAIRPEDLTASILFVRGSPLALVQNLGLYVRWLACQAPDAMPRSCPDNGAVDCPCGKTNQV